MKQKVKPSNTLVTKSFLKSSIKRELSSLEKRLGKKFATKDDLKNFATKRDWLTLKTDISSFKIDTFAEISRIEVKAIDREQNYHNDVMTQFDKIMKKLETMQQESAIDNFRRDEKNRRSRKTN